LPAHQREIVKQPGDRAEVIQLWRRPQRAAHRTLASIGAQDFAARTAVAWGALKRRRFHDVFAF
jgi:hypothetical protein